MKQSKQSKRIINSIRKEEKAVNAKIVPWEKNPMRYTVKQRIAIVAASMFLISVYTKYINFGHWVSIGFDMSSYPPGAAIFWLTGSCLAFMYGYYLNNKFLETIAMIGIGYSLIFTAGIVNTYYWQWVWWVT